MAIAIAIAISMPKEPSSALGPWFTCGTTELRKQALRAHLEC
jgi:hypothetical protein